MPYEGAQEGRTYAFDYEAFHDDPLCAVNLIMGPGYLVAYCTRCKVATQLEAVALKVDPDDAQVPRGEA